MNLVTKFTLLAILLTTSLFSNADLKQDYENAVCAKFRDVLQTTPLHTLEKMTWDKGWFPKEYLYYASTWDNDDCQVTFS
ncbi:hypothetical protein ACU6U9_14485 [Pseudomonas sp. HK3]